MDLPTIFVLAVALAMDAFAVAVASGIGLRRVGLRQTFRLSWHFGLFQAMMPVLGWAIGRTMHDLVQNFDHWLAFGLLAFIGSRMIFDAIAGREDDKSRGDPTRGLSLVMLSVGTSIDALAAGLGFSVLGLSIWLPAVIIGITALAFTALGLHLGVWIGLRIPIGKYAALLGGAVLILIGVRILFDHGVFD